MVCLKSIKIMPFKGLYLINNTGCVWSIRRRIYLKHSDRRGYSRVSLTSKYKTVTFSVHYLVALYFIGECPHGKEINHIDGNKKK